MRPSGGFRSHTSEICFTRRTIRVLFLLMPRRFYASEEFSETVRLLSDLGKKPDHGLRLLDVGCGNGIASYAFARVGYAVTGTDISEGELAGLRGARALIGLDKADFRIVNANMERMETAETFDVIYMRQALHHSTDPLSTVGNLSQSLTPGGIFCAVREHVILNDAQRRRFLAATPIPAYHSGRTRVHDWYLSKRLSFSRIGTTS